MPAVITSTATFTDNALNALPPVRALRCKARARKSQTITFGALSNQAFGTAPFTVSATASSGLAVSFTSTTSAVCTVSGATVTLVASGTCTIQATQAGNANYAAATPVNQSFQVTQESQTITFGALSNQALGTAPFTVSATASSGLAVSFTSTTPAVCTVSGSDRDAGRAGTCTIQATQAGNANYAAATPVNQSFQVTQESQTITFGALSNQAFGTAPFTVSATASSGLAVSFASTTTAVCTVSGATVTLVARGHLHHPGDAGGQRQLRRRHAGQPELHGDAGKPDHHLRRTLEPGVRHRAVHGQRDGVVGPGRELHFDHLGRLHGIGRDRDAGRRRHLHHPGDAGGQRQLRRGHAGEPELHGDAREPDHHLRRALEPGIRHRAVHGQRDRVLRPGGQLHFAQPRRLHGIGNDRDAGRRGHLHDPGHAGGQRQLRRGHAGQPELHR